MWVCVWMSTGAFVSLACTLYVLWLWFRICAEIVLHNMYMYKDIQYGVCIRFKCGANTYSTICACFYVIIWKATLLCVSDLSFKKKIKILWTLLLKVFFLINFKQHISFCVQKTYFDSSIKTASSTEAAYCRFFCNVSAGTSPHCSCRKRLRNLCVHNWVMPNIIKRPIWTKSLKVLLT